MTPIEAFELIDNIVAKSVTGSHKNIVDLQKIADAMEVLKPETADEHDET